MESLKKVAAALLCLAAISGFMMVFSARMMEMPGFEGRGAMIGSLVCQEAMLVAYLMVRRYPWEVFVRGLVVVVWCVMIIFSGMVGLLLAAGSMPSHNTGEFLVSVVTVAVLNIMVLGRVKPKRELAPDEAAHLFTARKDTRRVGR